MLVKPAPGLKFRDPATKRVVPEEGLEVPDGHPMWTRMIADGDCSLVSAPPSPQANNKVPPPPPGTDSRSNGGEG